MTPDEAAALQVRFDLYRRIAWGNGPPPDPAAMHAFFDRLEAGIEAEIDQCIIRPPRYQSWEHWRNWIHDPFCEGPHS